MTSKVFRVVSLVCLLVAAGCGGGSSGKKLTDAGGNLDGGADGSTTGSDVARLPDGAPVVTGDPDGSVGTSDGAGLTGDVAPSDGAGATGDVAPPIVLLLGIDLNPAAAMAAAGTSVSFTATGRYSDGSTKDLTTVAVWTSSAANVATVAGGVAKALVPGSAMITATSMGQSKSAALTVTSATLASIAIEPADAKLPVSAKLALKATGVFSDGSKQDLSSQVVWTSSDATLATVGTDGTVTGKKAGNVTVTASFGAVTARATLTITPATLSTIDVTPVNPRLPLPGTQRFTATGLYSDGSAVDLTTSVTWDSSDKTVLTISSAAGSEGVAVSIAAGASVVTARLGAVSGSMAVTVLKATLVSIKVAPDTATIPKGTTQAFTATGTYSDGSTADITASVAWSAANETFVALTNAVGSQGVATGLAVGDTDVIATQAGIVGKAKISVSAATLASLAIAPKDASLPLGRKAQYTAIATYSDASKKDVTDVTVWAVADGTVAGISNASGTAGTLTALKVGSTEVRGTLGGKTDATKTTVTNAVLDTITVKPATVSVAAGLRQAFTATGNYSDATTLDLTTQAVWSSDAPLIATISNAAGIQGQAFATAPGMATLHAKLDGKDGTAQLTVTAPVLSLVSVSPISPGRRVGENIQFAASAIASNGTSQNVTLQAVWESSAPAIATINANTNPRGRATCVGVGTTTIKATYMNVSDSTVLTCTNPVLVGVQVTPFLSNIVIGQQVALVATALFSDSSTTNVTAQATWVSSAPTVAGVTTAGLRGRVTGLAAGATSVTATYMGLMGSASVNVSSATPVAISVSPILGNVKVGQVQAFAAVLVRSDGSTQNVTNLAAWSSSDFTVAAVSNNNPRGQATGLKIGTAKISASFMGFTDFATLTVTSPKLLSITVSPTSAKIRVGQNQQFQAIVLFDDGSSQNVTATSLWSSSDGAVAGVSNAGGSRGQATGLTVGAVKISAQYMTLSASADLAVTSPKLSTVTVAPGSITLLLGQTQALQATAVFDDGTTQNVTAQAVWTSADANIADVSNGGGGGGGGRGVVAGLAAGTVQIKATYMMLSGEASVIVSAAKITSISITPVAPTISAGGSQQMTATAIYDDNSTRNVTQMAIWSSTDPTVATVSTVANRGVVAGLKAGSVDVSAMVGTFTGKTTVTVSVATITDIQVTPTNPLILVGGTAQFAATAVFSDFSLQNITALATWAPASGTVVQVSNAAGSRGRATGIGSGTAIISASYMGITGSSSITVTSATIKSIQITPLTPATPIGIRTQFQATAVLTDATSLDVSATVTWTSSDDSIVGISNVGGSRGQGTAVKAGTATITATLGGVSGSTVYTVGAQTLTSIAVTPAASTLAKGATSQFKAVGTYSDASTFDLTGYATWISTAGAVASVSNAAGSRGVVTGISAGMSTIEAHLGGISGATGVTVP